MTQNFPIAADAVHVGRCFLTPAYFSIIFGLFKQAIQFLQQINVKISHVHPVFGAGIRTHDLRNMSLLP